MVWKVPIHLANWVNICSSPSQGKSAAEITVLVFALLGCTSHPVMLRTWPLDGWLHGDPASWESAMVERTWHFCFAFGDNTSCLVVFAFRKEHSHIESSIPVRKSQFGTFSVFYRRQGKQRVPPDQSKAFKRQELPGSSALRIPAPWQLVLTDALRLECLGVGAGRGHLKRSMELPILVMNGAGWWKIVKDRVWVLPAFTGWDSWLACL